MNKVKEIIGNIPIYYINLDRSVDRRINIEKILSENELTYKRIKAIDGKELSLDKIKEKYTVNPKLTIYEIACALSHMNTIEEILKDGHEYAIVFEDDCNFEYLKYKNIPIRNLIKTDIDWDVIQLGSINDKKGFELISKSNDILTKHYDSGAHAYIINKKGIIKILENFSKTNHIEVSEKLLFSQSNCYCVKPYFTYYDYKKLNSTIRENSKSAFTTQRLSKLWWDQYYENCENK